MGFRVRTTGIDLVWHLRNNVKKLFGHEYSLYIIALATEVDDEALAGLIKNERAIDSLTGEDIAFITFYNSVRFFVDPADAPKAYSYKSLLRKNLDIYHRHEEGSKFAPTIEVPSELIKESHPYHLSEYLFKHVDLDYGAFALSMTYESDSIARYLGIEPSELPCLVFIDNPKSEEYYILPINLLGDKLITVLRKVIGQFYSHKLNKPYFELIRKFEMLTKRQSSVEYRMQRNSFSLDKLHKDLISGPHDLPEPIRFEKLIDEKHYYSAYQYLKSWLRNVFEGKVPIKLNNDLLNRFTPDLYTKSIDPEGTNYNYIRAFKYFSNRVNEGQLGDKDKINLHRFYEKIMVALLDDHQKPNKNCAEFTLAEWKSVFNLLMPIENLKKSLKKLVSIKLLELQETRKMRIQGLQETINQLDLNEVRRKRIDIFKQKTQQGISELEQEIADLKKEGEELKNELGAIGKKLNDTKTPQIAPILNKTKNAQKKAISSKLSKTFNIAVDKAETVLKAIELGAKISGSI